MKLEKNRIVKAFYLFVVATLLFGCKDDEVKEVEEEETTNFLYGADLSYLNQIVDNGGNFKVDNTSKDPYQIFAEKGTNVMRLRLWHNPTWTQDLSGTTMYNDIIDVERSIRQANGMEILLDLHYSDTWADPEHQYVPEAWENIDDIDVLVDSVYHYTYNTLFQLVSKGLTPKYIQLGNEINCGMFYTEVNENFPNCNVCNGHWDRLNKVLNSASQAIKDINALIEVNEPIETILHVADPANIDWWFSNLQQNSPSVDFDIIGISYYPLWHTTVSFDNLEGTISTLKSEFNKDIFIVETAYPWTTEHADDMNNLFGDQTPLNGYPYTQQGQYDYMVSLTQKMKNAGAIGVAYWEPDWVAVPIPTLWGTGSSWENCTYFDFNFNALPVFEYSNYDYEE